MKIIQSNARVRAKINKILAKEGNKALERASRNIERKVKPLIRKAVAGSPEISSLSGGTLKYDFGLIQDPAGEIVNAVVGSVVVNVSKIRATKAKFSGGITVSIQPDDLRNLLSLPVANQIIEDGSALPWLQWLLLSGDSIIIASAGVEYKSGGRSGGAVMSKDFAPFRVNPMFSGSSSNNFITRAIEPQGKKILQIMRSEFS